MQHHLLKSIDPLLLLLLQPSLLRVGKFRGLDLKSIFKALGLSPHVNALFVGFFPSGIMSCRSESATVWRPDHVGIEYQPSDTKLSFL